VTDIAPPGLVTALQDVVDWIKEQDDLTTKAIALKTTARQIKAWESQLAEQRYATAAQLAEAGWTMQDIGNLLGVSRQRAAQLVNGVDS
jgi:DNA-binding transcriptional regulator YbjK